MKRKVYLVGEIEKLFGSEFSVRADTYSEIIRNIECNRPGFKRYLLESDAKGIGFTINFAGKGIEEKDLLTPIREGDVTIAAVPAGSKSEVGMILTGVLLVAVSFMIPPAGLLGGAISAGQASAALIGIGTSLALQGIQMMMAPDPATEEKAEEGYLFSGEQALIVEGDPVPLLYGKMRVPGQPISVALTNKTDNASLYGSGGEPGKASGDQSGGGGETIRVHLQ